MLARRAELLESCALKESQLPVSLTPRVLRGALTSTFVAGFF